MTAPAPSSRRRNTPGDRTRCQILDSAEKICAEQGLESLSVRAVSEDARVNLAAINYHFGGKQGLIEAMFARRVVPMNARRLALLDGYAAQGREPALEEIVHAFVHPPLWLRREPGCGPHASVVVSRFLARAFITAGEPEFLAQYYEPVRSRFILALRGQLPGLELPELLWRYNMMVGAVIYAMGGTDRMSRPPQALQGIAAPIPCDEEAGIRYMVRFLAAGLRMVGSPRPAPARKAKK